MLQLRRLRPLPRCMTFLSAGLLIAALSVGVVIWIGSTRIIVPDRRALEPRHFDVLADPAAYGLDLAPFEVLTGDGHTLRAIRATRSAAPGPATKMRAMEQRLARHGIHPQASPRGTIILLHGRGGRKEDLLWVAKRFVAADFQCVVYDARAHGTSEGDYCTFGQKESKDLQSVIGQLGGHTGPIGLFGNSLGAAVALQSSDRVSGNRAVVAVSPFADLREIVTRSGQRMIHRHLPASMSDACLRLGGRRAGFDPFSISPLKDAGRSSIPLFLVHGARDGVIPIDHGRRIFDAAGTPLKVWREVPTGEHGNVLAEGGDALYEEIILFYLRHLAEIEVEITTLEPHEAGES